MSHHEARTASSSWIRQITEPAGGSIPLFTVKDAKVRDDDV
jgi:hypothetical protein